MASASDVTQRLGLLVARVTEDLIERPRAGTGPSFVIGLLQSLVLGTGTLEVVLL
jgi:hypothetical protein